MKKNTLKDMKSENRRLLIKTLVEKKSLARIELAQITNLSPSTVSSLVSELLDQGLFAETGVSSSTGGRKRTELSLNKDFAALAILEVRRNRTVIRIFDMLLNEKDSMVLSNRYLTGDELLAGAVETLSAYTAGGGMPVTGLGLLFQEDMTETEFSVMYSTSLSSDTISLRDALTMSLHIPVVEDYSQCFSITHVLSGNAAASKGSTAFITIGSQILASIALDGVPVSLKEGRKVMNITPLLGNSGTSEGLLADGGEGFPGKSRAKPGNATPIGETVRSAAQALAAVLKPLCVFFQLDTVFLSGRICEIPEFKKAAEKMLCRQLRPLPSPKIQLAEINTGMLVNNLAVSLQNKILLSE
ncbi:winged helix-turn-helix domain-containing protein [Breznakiella homolactica]|uniref:Winged helix-turn-helix transcriptional regulator n=1 Tax=Breznakiella homolactica TaxID=2798577 RepID=A0A7T7XRI9_9SPIR|nr:winged helix-turn-helix domain-containing protein [Breznakiella homolactica]QQO11172.1 winged helix-turn-helix domain-containing protein [Breznakiella homolactica]